ncbi:RNA demethylase ALKBH9B isoform X1 [Andrographis paniculata]|uniref:RNA demethylase ALKBH9B isoform X1 n=1 Tax=Andrographis paniculata TaxID=175694 RepID=UPI0021E8EA89|nr:RNA demethylase ALKBH9B isoform X1 [Andrographis paniculata]
MADRSECRTMEDFLRNFTAEEIKVAGEFLYNWLPFVTEGLCGRCTRIIGDRISSLSTGMDVDQHQDEHEKCSAHSGHSAENNHDDQDSDPLGSWKDEAEYLSEQMGELQMPIVSISSSPSPAISTVKKSWADMATEDDLALEETDKGGSNYVNYSSSEPEALEVEGIKPKVQLSRDQREYIRFNNVQRKKDFISLERINGKLVNILEGLELHKGIFSAAEQKRIVNFVEELQEKGRNGQLKERTYSAPVKWMRGKGRQTLQFGCCYNYATDKNGNPPGIMKREYVDPLPDLFKTMIKRLVRWRVLPPSCVPDSCIVNIYEEGDCIPPHIDNHDFVRPFCTVSFLSECEILFGSNLRILGPGEFDGKFSIPLPVGSVLVLNGNGADVAKHCVPAVPHRRVSITFRRMDVSKRPYGYAPEPDLVGIEPLWDEPHNNDESNKLSNEADNRSSMVEVESRSKNSDEGDGWKPYSSSRTRRGYRKPIAGSSSGPRYSGRSRDNWRRPRRGGGVGGAN